LFFICVYLFDIKDNPEMKNLLYKNICLSLANDCTQNNKAPKSEYFEFFDEYLYTSCSLYLVLDLAVPEWHTYINKIMYIYLFIINFF
jgi:hypothetical protein